MTVSIKHRIVHRGAGTRLQLLLSGANYGLEGTAMDTLMVVECYFALNQHIGKKCG